MNPNNWLDRHKHFNAALDADQVECQAMLAGVAHVETGIEDERMAGVVDDALVDRGNSWSERQSVLEEMAGAVAEELARRREVMKQAYPFEISQGGALRHLPSKSGVYEFSLAVARNPTGVLNGAPKASAVFEMIARDILSAHFGKGTSGFRTGAPPYEFEHRGNSARDTFQALQQKCGEFCWNPEAGFPYEPTFKHLKDAGLDVVVWKPWADGRLGHFFALGQCGCGKNDVEPDKARELSIERLRTWLRPVCHAPPMRCFLLAHHIPNTMALYELSKEGGIVFDRARIALVAESDPNRVKSPLNIDYHKLALSYAKPRVAARAHGRRKRTAAAGQRSQ